MGHLQQLLRRAHAYLAEHVKPATARKESVRTHSETNQAQVGFVSRCAPGIFRRLCEHLVGSLIRDDVQRVLLLVIVHDLPAEKKTRVSHRGRSRHRPLGKTIYFYAVGAFICRNRSLGGSDVDGSLQLLLTVIVVVHQLVVPQYEPAHLPVSTASAENS